MIIKLKELERTDKYVKYKVVDTDITKDIFDKYMKENNLEKLTDDDKVQILKNVGYEDDEIEIILDKIGD